MGIGKGGGGVGMWAVGLESVGGEATGAVAGDADLSPELTSGSTQTTRFSLVETIRAGVPARGPGCRPKILGRGDTSPAAALPEFKQTPNDNLRKTDAESDSLGACKYYGQS